MKNPLTPAGIEPATFRFVAQHLNLTTVLPQSPGLHSTQLLSCVTLHYSKRPHLVLATTKKPDIKIWKTQYEQPNYEPTSSTAAETDTLSAVTLRNVDVLKRFTQNNT